MIIEGINPVSGESCRVESATVEADFIDWSKTLELTDQKVKKTIDNLEVSADIKSLLYTFSKATLKAGEYILKIGRKIVDYICKLFSEYPSVSFGMIFGAIVGVLISSIPILGAVLGSIAIPILTVFGMIGGLKEDLKDKALARKIADINSKFSSLQA